MRSPAVLWIVMVAAATQSLAAQRRVQVTPFVAAYYSARELGKYVAPDTSGTGVKGQVLQTSSPAIGVSVGMMLSDVLGMEVSGAYAFSNARVQACDPSKFCLYQDQGGTLMVTSLAGRYRPRRSNFEGLAGLSMVIRGGDIWSGRSSNTSLGGMLGAGVVAQVTPKLALNVRGELHAYSFDPDESGSDWNSAMAMDFVFRVGVPLGGRR